MEKKEKSIVYKGLKISEPLLKTLSTGVQQWLEYYQSLSEQQKMMVNYEPYELTKVCNLGINTPETVHDANNYDFNGHPVFNQNFWNLSANIKKANCYAHAMNVTVTTDGAKLQPGEILNIYFPLYKEDLIGAANVIKANSIKDATSGLFDRKIGLRVCTQTDTPKANEYMVALCVAPIIGTSLFFDYHWYKCDFNGNWSHKRGNDPAVQVDASEKTINAENLPHLCNRDYGELSYSHFVDYFMVTHN